MPKEGVSGSSFSSSAYPYVERALHFFGVERKAETDGQRCEELLEVLANRGLDVSTFLTAAGGTSPRSVPGASRLEQCQELSYEGYRELQKLQRLGFDTVADLDTSSIDSVEALYEAVIGKAMRQESCIGIITTGPITLTGMTSQAWNERNKGARLGAHEEVWQVRSHPKGRIGQKLIPGEVRKVTVLIRSNLRHETVGKITTVELQLLPTATAAGRPDVQRGQATYGANGVGDRAIHLWEHQGSAFLAQHDLPEGMHHFHAVYGGYVLLVRQLTEGPNAGALIPQSMQSDYVPHLVLAGSLAGFSIPDRPMHRRGMSNEDQRQWSHEKHIATSRFTSGIGEAYPDRDSATFSGRLIFAAADMADQTSLLGLLDKLADPFYEHGLPDDLMRPNGLMLILAVAVRIACDPSRVGVPVPTLDDVWATRSMCNLLESAHPHVLSLGANDPRTNKTRGTYSYAVDLFLEDTIMTLQSDLEVYEHEKAMPKDTVDSVRKTMQNSLETLHCLGVAICIDVCGASIKQPDQTSGIYTEFGLAHGCCDPVQEARNQTAYDAGMGNLAPWSRPTRTSTHSARQTALVHAFGCVERWLLEGTHHGIVLPPRSNAPVCAGATELCVNRTYDERGNVSSVTIRREPLPEGLTGAAAAAAEGLRKTTTQAAAAAATAAAPQAASKASAGAGASGSGNKKKQRAAAKREAKAANQAGGTVRSGAPLMNSEMSDLAAETRRRTQGRPMSESDALEQVATTMNNRQRERARAHRDTLRKKVLLSSSLVDGGEMMSNIFQQGVARGVTEVIDAQTFLVGRGSSIRCAHCERFVNVVQGLAFAGQFSKCLNCHHPRCLHCVDADIDAVNKNAADAQPVLGRDLFGCLFCIPQ